MSQERCRCGTCGRFIGHVAEDDPSCANEPVWKPGVEWRPIICERCKAIMRNDYDPPIPWP